MSRFLGVFAAIIFLFGLAPASASVVVTVDKTAQNLTVNVNGVTRYSWPVSTARWGYRTPVGSYRPERLERQWYSRKYDWSPMPHSIFFSGGYAIHGSYEVSRLGRPASHGCIRLAPANAATLFALVKANSSDTRIVIRGGGEELMARPSRSTPRETVSYSRSRERVIYSEPRRQQRDIVTYSEPLPAYRQSRRVEAYAEPQWRTEAPRGRRASNFEDIFDEPRRR
jgi:hypothetical protein